MLKRIVFHVFFLFYTGIDFCVLLCISRECPEELKEAASSLIYAASRCGEFPELQKIREVLTSRFGREFAARAVELRNTCGVNSKVVNEHLKYVTVA